MEGGEVYDRLEKEGCLPESDVVQITRQVIEAINYCHSQKIAHRDLKPENILLEKDRLSVKLVDFGLSADFTNASKTILNKTSILTL